MENNKINKIDDLYLSCSKAFKKGSVQNIYISCSKAFIKGSVQNK